MSSQLAADGKVEEYTLNDLFSLRRPRDFRAGLASGSKSLAKGVLGGAMGLVAAPVMGALQGGVLGFGKGVLAGGLPRLASANVEPGSSPQSLHVRSWQIGHQSLLQLDPCSSTLL